MPLSEEFLVPYSFKAPPWGFNGLGYIVYKRTYARITEDGQTEEWWQTCQRVVDGANAIGAELTKDESERLFDYMFNLKGLPGGRMLWQLGTPNNFRLGGDSLCNCWFVDIKKPEDFAWMFERLMLGGGVCFSILHPQRLGIVRQGVVTNHNVPDADYITPDKREGWSECLLRAMKTYLGSTDDPTELSYSTEMIRPAGAPIKTFGGTASGPGILVEGITKICALLDKAVGRHLKSTEVLDIGNIIGSVVVAGNVRRSAEIALGDPYDIDYLSAKRWDLGNIPPHRAMSNNSIVTSDTSALPDAFWDGYRGNGEPYGLFNLEAARKLGRSHEFRLDKTIEGTNPCAEIGLANRESCNLADIFLPNIESQNELIDLAKLLYKIQKAVAALPYLDRESDEITSKNMRLGLGVSGIAQAKDKLDWLSPTYEMLRDFDQYWSTYKEWPPSVRLTTVKPSGTLSLLAGVTPGIHPGYSRYHIRRVRMAAGDPLLPYCESRGYKVEWVESDNRTKVVEFPCEFPEDTVIAADMTAVQQLQLQGRLQHDWADNAVSVTVYLQPEELTGVRQYLKENWHSMKSVSFLLHSKHGFAQAPLEEISHETYLAMKEVVKQEKVLVGVGSSELLDEDCATGACPIR